MRHVNSRRLLYVLLSYAVLLAILCIRLAWLQLSFKDSAAVSGPHSTLSEQQRIDRIVLDSGRGQFRDRYGRLITGEITQSLVAFPYYGQTRGSEAALKLAAQSLQTDSEQLKSWLDGLVEPQLWPAGASSRPLDLTDGQIEEIRRAGLIGVTVLPYRQRYPVGMAALHAIGYISQHPERIRQLADTKTSVYADLTAQIGGIGLEKSLERLIKGIGPTTAMQVTDATRHPLAGLGIRMTAPNNPYYPLQVTTTLDLDIQQAAEEVLNKYSIAQGAIVVLDVNNADILAMVSRPHLNPNRIGAPDTDERNHAITAFPPGSIFKTVTLAAAIESGIADANTVFECDGEYERYHLKCWKEGGHGKLTLLQAYAESCNVAFAELAERMSPAWLQATAERLGLGRTVGWRTESFLDGEPLIPLGEEENGAVFHSRELAEDGGVRAGTGIGQRDVRVTPLQAANMVVTILHGGQVQSPRVMRELKYADGGLLTRFRSQTLPSRLGDILPDTAALLQAGMRRVVSSGTAKQALYHHDWTLAGKSGTAELAGSLAGRNDHWFIGYGPVNGPPRYAVAVLIEQQRGGISNRAAQLFGELMSRLRSLELLRLESAAEQAVAPRTRPSGSGSTD